MAARRILLLVPTTSYRSEDFVEAAHRLGLGVTVASEEASSVTSLDPKALLTVDFDDPVATVREFADRVPIDAVVAVDDRTSIAGAVIAEALGLSHNSVDSVRAAHDKALLREMLAGRGVAQPDFRSLEGETPWESVESAARELGFPVVVKPTMLSGSRGVIRANDVAELRDAWPRVVDIVREAEANGDRRVLLEEYVDGGEVAVEGILSHGELRILAIFDKPDPLDGPTFAETIYVTPSELPDATQQRIALLTQHACLSIGLEHGPIHAELRGANGDLRFIEIAARSIGGLCGRALKFGVGMTLEEIILGHALGEDVAVARERTAAGVHMIPVPAAGRFREVRGIEAARDVAGIEEVTITVHEGQELTPLPEGSIYVGFIFARGETPGDVVASLRTAMGCMAVVIE